VVAGSVPPTGVDLINRPRWGCRYLFSGSEFRWVRVRSHRGQQRQVGFVFDMAAFFWQLISDVWIN